MAVLSDSDRLVVVREFVQKAFVGLKQRADFDTNQLKAAVDATDAWIDGNAASYNAALPEPFRANASATQKTLLFCYAALKRADLI